MDDITAYLALTGAMGLMQAWEGYYLSVQESDSLNIDWSFSLIEFTWVVVSIFVLITSNLSLVEYAVPITYIIWNVIGWFLSAKMYYETRKNLENIFVIPEWYLTTSIIYGALFFALCCGSLFMHVSLTPDLSLLEYFKNNKLAIITIASVIASVIIMKYIVKNYALNLYKTQSIEAIQDNNICSEYFGKIIDIELNEDLTAEYEQNIFAYNVVGNKTSGQLVAHFLTLNDDKELITDGYIELESGEIIELETKAKEM